MDNWSGSSIRTERCSVKPPVIFIVGPTASGKSGLALQVAARLGAEICSMDAFQIYRNLDIGTGKTAISERCGIAHQLLDLVDPLESFSVADYLNYADGVLADATTRSLPQVWVGGTGLYFRALRHGLSPAPQSDPTLVAELSLWTLEQLQKEILRQDPVWSAGADMNNHRRMIRALAVAKQTGKPLSSWHQIKGRGLITHGRAYFLQPDPDALKNRIRSRIDDMWRAGWKEEVQRLSQQEGWSASQSAQALGYSQICAFLSGNLTEEECMESIRISTWQYARRQLTWFRREENLEILDPARGTETLLQDIDKGGKS